MDTQPLVTVICLCYNQGRFVREAVESVFQQTYKPIQLIVVDDASTDDSAVEIKTLKQEYVALEILLLESNLGNCKAFNRALTLAKGEYIIDLAADDVLLPERIEKGVEALLQRGPLFGVNFCDAELIDEAGQHLAWHSARFPHDTIPEGDVYAQLINRYFICPPTLMFSRKVIDMLGGYDETLTYEDFDFWVRSSRTFHYCYTPEALVKKRQLKNALAKKQFQVFSRHSESTYRVCEKIMAMNKSPEEREALAARIRYEAFLNLRLLNFNMMFRFLVLGIRNKRQRFSAYSSK